MPAMSRDDLVLDGFVPLSDSAISANLIDLRCMPLQTVRAEGTRRYQIRYKKHSQLNSEPSLSSVACSFSSTLGTPCGLVYSRIIS
jgi:hypothetical protein